MNLLFLSTIKTFFGKYLVVALLLLIAGGSAYYLITVTKYKLELAVLKVNVATLTGEVRALRLVKDTLVNTNAQYKDLTEAQNKSLEDILVVVHTTNRRTFEELSKVRKGIETYKKDYDVVFSKPAQSTDPCTSFGIRYDEYITKRKSENKQ